MGGGCHLRVLPLALLLDLRLRLRGRRSTYGKNRLSPFLRRPSDAAGRTRSGPGGAACCCRNGCGGMRRGNEARTDDPTRTKPKYITADITAQNPMYSGAWPRAGWGFYLLHTNPRREHWDHQQHLHVPPASCTPIQGGSTGITSGIYMCLPPPLSARCSANHLCLRPTNSTTNPPELCCKRECQRRSYRLHSRRPHRLPAELRPLRENHPPQPGGPGRRGGGGRCRCATGCGSGGGGGRTHHRAQPAWRGLPAPAVRRRHLRDWWCAFGGGFLRRSDGDHPCEAVHDWPTVAGGTAAISNTLRADPGRRTAVSCSCKPYVRTAVNISGHDCNLIIQPIHR